MVVDYLRQTGQGVLDGRGAPQGGAAALPVDVEYADNAIATALRDVARVHTAGLGTRVFYTQHGGYDHHAQELPSHNRLLGELTSRPHRLHCRTSATTTRRTTWPSWSSPSSGAGSRTTAAAPTTAPAAGPSSSATGVRGRPLRRVPLAGPADWLNGEDLRHTVDFRGVYSTMLEQWMGIERAPHRRRGVRAAAPLPGRSELAKSSEDRGPRSESPKSQSAAA